MKLVNGMWSPDEVKEAWLSGALINGLPSYQYDEIQAVIKACGGRRRAAVDIGAHIGTWTVHFMRAFKHTLAVEPISNIYDCLRLNVGAHMTTNSITLASSALSDKVGLVEMAPRSMGWAVAPFHRPDHKTVHSAVKSIPCKTLDCYDLLEVDLIKLDVEGHEYEALLGGEKTIRRDKPVIIMEEKLDPNRRATELLLNKWGMICTKVYNKHDYLFVWP